MRDELTDEELSTIRGLQKQRNDSERHLDRYILLIVNRDLSPAGLAKALGVAPQQAQAHIQAARDREDERARAPR